MIAGKESLFSIECETFTSYEAREGQTPPHHVIRVVELRLLEQ